MGQYTSYYLYQKFEKRDGQDFIPVYPNTYSVDADGTMPRVVKNENDENCGYIPPAPTEIYRWVQITPTSDPSTYVCDECPAEPIYRWTVMTPTSDPSSYICDDCPIVAIYRWVDSGTTCVDCDKYQRVIKQVSYDNGSTWENVSPAEYSATTLIEANSYDCGYRTRTTSTTYCDGVDKYVDVYSQVSYDSGNTWETTATTTTLIKINSKDCGYIHDYSQDYLQFTATETGTFRFSGVTTAHTVSYSLNSGTSWTTLANDTDSPTVTVGKTILWKANLTPRRISPYGIGRFSSTGRFTAEGNPMSLLYGSNFQNQTSLSGKTYAFMGLFSGCTGITSAEDISLPATTLSDYCYYGMFADCTSLTTIPELPATKMEPDCYNRMFAGCTSLTTVPSNYLPATTLERNCYFGMFSTCTSLTTAPDLPASAITSWDWDCYRQMFYNCYSLTTAPNLPSTTLSESCYDEMFYDCTSLTTAPDLPATTLKEKCYYRMFYGCTSLNYVKCLATDISASNSIKYWLSNVASSGTFVKDSNTTWPSGASGIPSDWTVQDAT